MLSNGSCNLLFNTCLLAAVVLASGCKLSPSPGSDPTTASTFGAITGAVHGGQQAVVGAHLYLLAVGTSGYGTSSTSLLNNVPGTTTEDSNGNYYVTTGAGGSFSLGGLYTCTSGTQVYIYAVGGNPGAGTNTGAGLMAALGQCPSSGTLAGQVPALNVDEVTTVATAFAFAGFAVDPMDVAHSGTALAQTGIANAFANVPNIINIGTGLAYTTTPNGNGTVPQARIHTLANILAACINSTGVTSAQCSSLFAHTTLDGTSTGTKPTDTAAAIINLAHHPGNYTTTLYNLQQSVGAPFAPALTTAPSDFTLSVSYTGGGLGIAPHLAIDADGNLWTTPDGTSTVTKHSPQGVALSGTSGYTSTGLSGSKDLAIDANNDAIALGSYSTTVLILTTDYGSVTTIPNSGAGASTSSFLANPRIVGIGLDSSGDVYFADGLLGSLVSFSPGGSTTSRHIGGGISVGTNYTALDGSGNIWVTNGNNSLSKFSPAGLSISLSGGFTGGGLNAPSAIAVDSTGNAWTTNSSGNSLSEFNSSGSALSTSSGYTGGGLNKPVALAADGNGNLWVANATGNSLSQFSGTSGAALTSSSGLTAASLDTPNALAIDGSGNLWVGNTSSATITQFIGLAYPVVTPLATAVANNTLATRP